MVEKVGTSQRTTKLLCADNVKRWGGNYNPIREPKSCCGGKRALKKGGPATRAPARLRGRRFIALGLCCQRVETIEEGIDVELRPILSQTFARVLLVRVARFSDQLYNGIPAHAQYLVVVAVRCHAAFDLRFLPTHPLLPPLLDVMPELSQVSCQNQASTMPLS